jgi:hypothetical protein
MLSSQVHGSRDKHVCKRIHIGDKIGDDAEQYSVWSSWCNGCGWEEDSVKLDYGFPFWHGFFSVLVLAFFNR